MSGMAGNVTAFNTVWTYDIYQSLHPAGPDRDAHYLRMGRAATVVRASCQRGRGLRWRRAFNNIMDMLQLIFSFRRTRRSSRRSSWGCSGARPVTARSGDSSRARLPPACTTR